MVMIHIRSNEQLRDEIDTQTEKDVPLRPGSTVLQRVLYVPC
jgi:hypothetical protein